MALYLSLRDKHTYTSVNQSESGSRGQSTQRKHIGVKPLNIRFDSL